MSERLTCPNCGFDLPPGTRTDFCPRCLLGARMAVDLAGVRDQAVLAKLPEIERAAWRSLWTDVENLLK